MSDETNCHNLPELSGQHHSFLFVLAVRKDSNLAMDWLWLAGQLEDPNERQYCVKRAHYIDPNNVIFRWQRPGLVVRLKNLIHTTLKKENTSDSRPEVQLATNF